MLDKIFQQNIKELFNEQKYQEIIFKIEKHSSKKDRPASFSSIVGMCKILKPNSSKNEILSALSDFEDSYNKSKTNEGGIEALCNYITACIRNSQKYIEVLDCFEKAKKMYDEAEKNFGYHEKLFSHGVDLYKYSLDHNKVKQLLKTIISNKSKSKIIACLNGHFNNYTYDWKQKDYFNYSKIFQNFFPKYEAKKIEEINYNKNKKIKIGFVSNDFVGDHTCTFFTKKTISHLDNNTFETYEIALTGDSNLKNSSLE
jgi:Predicted O-linked N-acetylglucosamine transferase, SPINDLY family